MGVYSPAELLDGLTRRHGIGHFLDQVPRVETIDLGAQHTAVVLTEQRVS